MNTPRSKDLKNSIRESLGIIQQYEAIVRASDRPEEKLRARRIIREQKALTEGYLAEYHALIGEYKELPNWFTEVECPYRGLEPFQPEHAEFYFGREQMVEQLAAKVRTCSFVTVIGPSGCGKSSLVRAGLTSALEKDGLENGQTWTVRFFRPGKTPLRVLAKVLIGLMEPDADRSTWPQKIGNLADHLSIGTQPMTDVAVSLQDTHLALSHLVLVADQFEELYTECPDEDVRQHFIAALLAASRAGIKVVLTLRADFYGRVLEDRSLGEKVDAGQVTVLPLSQDGLRAAIEWPAVKVGRAFEPDLVDRILKDVVGEPGNLPLLEFALTELWAQQTVDGLLIHEAYEEIGAVGGAIAQRAENVYEELSEQGYGEIVRWIFLRLAHYDQDAQNTRRRIALDDLITAHTPRKQVEKAIRALADTRLLVIGREETTVVEMAHEALIQNWDRLRRWLDKDRDFGLWREKIASVRRIWEGSRYDEGALLRGAALVEAREWLAERGDDLNEAELTFIQASRALQEREKAERETQAQVLTRRGRLVWGLIGGFAILVIVALLSVSRVDTDWQKLTPIGECIGGDGEPSQLIVVTSSTNADLIYASDQTPGGLYRSRNGGLSWSQIGTDLPLDLQVNGIAAAKRTVYVTTPEGIFVSQDQGKSWSRGDWWPEQGPDQQPQCAAVDPRRPSRAYVGTQNAGLLVTQDSGSTWSPLETPPGVEGSLIRAIATDGVNVVIATESGIWTSQDAAKTWVPATGKPVDVLGLVMMGNRGRFLMALGERGVGNTDIGSDSWLPLEDPPPCSYVYSVSASDGTRYVGGQCELLCNGSWNGLELNWWRSHLNINPRCSPN